MIINVTRFSYLPVTRVLMGLPSSSLLPESSSSWPTFSTLCSNCSWCRLLRYKGRAILPTYLYFKDGKLTVFESCGICILSVASTMMIIVDLIILIWVRDYTVHYPCTIYPLLQGSVVVFGAWSSWTPDYAEYAAQPGVYNYCDHTPMLFAFVILLLKWVGRTTFEVILITVSPSRSWSPWWLSSYSAVAVSVLAAAVCAWASLTDLFYHYIV